MEEKKLNIGIECGADFVLADTITDDNDSPVDLTGTTVTAQLRESEQSADGFDFVCTHNGAGGKIILYLPKEVTEQITFTSGRYDVFVVINGVTYRPLYGDAYISPNVTKVSDGTFLYILGFDSYEDFPETGKLDRLYMSYDWRCLYRWNGTNYIEVTNSRGIASIDLTSTTGLVREYTITYNDHSTYTFTVADGRSIETVTLVSSVGLVDTYRMTFNDGTTFDYTVTNGSDMWGNITGTLSDQTDLYNALNSKASAIEKSASGSIVSVDDAAACSVAALSVSIEPVQAGSGDPTPDNVRAIAGWTQVKIFCETAYDENADPAVTIALGQTVYGGSFDVKTGVLTVTHAFFEFDGSSDESWSVAATGTENYLYLIATNTSVNTSGYKISNLYPYVSLTSSNQNQGIAITSGGQVRVRWGTEQTISDWRTTLANQPLQICCELTTPLTVQLTASGLTLSGQNVVWASTGDIAMTYKADTKAYIDDHYTKAETDTLLSAKADTASLGTMSAVNDAPSNGNNYLRKNGVWANPIDDSAGDGDTDKVFSADKVYNDVNEFQETTNNIYYHTKEHYENNGVTVDRLADGSYLFNGTASARVRIPAMGAASYSANNLPAGTYSFGWNKISGSCTLNGNTDFAILAGGHSTTNAQVREGKSSNTTTFANDTTCYFNISSGSVLTKYRVQLWCNVGSTLGNFYPHKTPYDFIARKTVNSQVTHLRIATYNIGNFNYGQSDLGMDDALVSEKLPTWKELLGDLRPDILCMQEFCLRLDRSSNYSASEDLFEPLYPHMYISPTVTSDRDGNAVASKYQANWWTEYDIYDTILNANRRIMHLNITVDGKDINIFSFALMATSTALDRLDELGITDKTPKDVREDELRLIIEIAQNYPNAILAGDYNTKADELAALQPAVTAGYRIGNNGYFGWVATTRTDYSEDDPQGGNPLDNIVTDQNIIIDHMQTHFPAHALATSDHLPFILDVTIM